MNRLSPTLAVPPLFIIETGLGGVPSQFSAPESNSAGVEMQKDNLLLHVTHMHVGTGMGTCTGVISVNWKSKQSKNTHPNPSLKGWTTVLVSICCGRR